MEKKRPIFKWAGGKYNCVERIIAALPAGQRLIEPFTGAATIFFNTSYSRYLLAESNRDLLMFYRQLQKHGEDFIAYCRNYFTLEANMSEIYYTLRDSFNKTHTGKKRAALFLYLNRHGYNGLCRYNQSGLYNVPFGHHTTVLFPEAAMSDFIARSQDIEFLHADFRKTFRQAKPGDIIYCDPPYVPLQMQQKPFQYDKNGFNEADQIALAQLARKYSQRGITVVLSNHDTDFTRTHYQGAEITSFPVNRLINCKGDKRQPVYELLAIFKAKI